MYKSICLLLILALATSTQVTFESEYEAQRAINHMESTAFGHNILQTIQVQMKNGDPADDLLRLLMDIEDGIQADQSADDEYALNLANQCVEEIEKIENSITRAQEKLEKIEKELMEKVPLRNNKENQLADKEDFKAMIEEKIAQLDAQQALKQAEWDQEREEHDAATAAIETAKNIIVGSLTDTSFLQTTKDRRAAALVQVGEHFGNANKALKYKSYKSWNSIFKLLSQVTQEVVADSSSVQTVIDLCDLILEQIAESRALEKKDFDGWMSEYESNRGGQVKLLDDTNSKILQLENAIAILTKRINGLRTSQAENEQKLANKQEQLKEKEDFCDAEQKAYMKRREERNDDEQVVSQAIGLLGSEIRTLKKYINARMG